MIQDAAFEPSIIYVLLQHYDLIPTTSFLEDLLLSARRLINAIETFMKWPLCVSAAELGNALSSHHVLVRTLRGALYGSRTMCNRVRGIVEVLGRIV